MGDWYGFEIQVIDGKEVSGFSYQNEATGWKEVFVEFTESQKQWANEWASNMNDLNEMQSEAIKSWIS